MKYLISKDGETWLEISTSQLEEVVNDAGHPEIWIGLDADSDGMTTMPLSVFRKLADAPPTPVDAQDRATELYGIPIVYENPSVANRRHNR